MTSSEFDSGHSSSVLREEHIETGFIGTLQGLKYEFRRDIINRATLEANFREKFESLNRVRLTGAEFARLLDEIVTPDVFTASKTQLCFMQLFIVSNRDRTDYFANNNARHFAFNADERFLPVYEYADEANRKITHLEEFADVFLKKCDLGRTISRYMVLIASEQKLMIMRPYEQ